MLELSLKALTLDSAIYTNTDNEDCDRQVSGPAFRKIVQNRKEALEFIADRHQVAL